MPRIKQAAQEMLNNVILPFWMSLKDETHGGYYGLVDFDLQVDKAAEKGCILNSRILWFFSEAAMLTGRADAAACARHAYQWFEDHCFDRENGGVYWSCDALGRPLDTTKHTYNQAFAIYALSAYYRLTGQQAALDRALELFRLIESRCTDAEGYLEAFTVDWKPESNEKLSENGVMADKTMNTLLHVFEGYAGLYQASRDPAVGQAMRRILGIYAGKVYSPALHRQLVFFDSHYRSIIDLYSYGHDIESSWLIDWGCALLGDDALTARIGPINSDLARSVYQHAYRDHSLLNECERGVDDTTRVWWVQAEAVLGFVNEYEKSGGEAYAAAAADIWHYITDKLVDKRPGGALLHTYYGPRLPDRAPDLTDGRRPHDDPGCWTDLLPKEWSAPGAADHRTPPCIPAFADGSETAELTFVQAEAAAGKPALPGLPAFRDGDGVETLTLTLRDVFGLEVQLRYTVYEAEDLITRTAVYTNTSSLPLTLHKAASLCLDFAPGPMDLITLNGTWAAERTPERAPLRWGIQSIGSTRGIPGHAHNPAAILCTPDCTETAGSCWGFALVYSGNFLIEAQRADAGQRLVMGIHPYHFHWQLEPGASFAAPEAAMVYSDQGLGEMSRRFHNAIRTRLLPPRWQDMKALRPVLLNSWEACYFDFDEAKLLALAGAARQADIDLFVLDDGWFKGRNGTTSSLGDWTADRAKLPDGLPGLCAKLNAMGLGLGLWVEPEAVSPDSDLYRAHPDWAFAVPGRQPCQIRCQYNLDLSRPEVVDGVWQQLEQVLRSCPIQYLKWDMNRALADVYSPALPAARQGEVYHRYVLGLYELQRRVTETFPDLLLENCAGGGAYLWHLAADVEPDYTVTVVSRLSPEEALLDAVEEKLTALAAAEPNAGLVVLADCGEADNIHPVDKEPAGRRLALLALETVYAQPVAGRSPQPLEARRGPGPGQVLLRFAHHAGGMQVRGGGMQLAGADGVFRDAQAAPAGPDRILACCGALRDPCAVRYAWYNYGPAGLYGGTGLPAAPFGPRTLND